MYENMTFYKLSICCEREKIKGVLSIKLCKKLFLLSVVSCNCKGVGTSPFCGLWIWAILLA